MLMSATHAREVMRSSTFFVDFKDSQFNYIEFETAYNIDKNAKMGNDSVNLSECMSGVNACALFYRNNRGRYILSDIGYKLHSKLENEGYTILINEYSENGFPDFIVKW